MVRKIRFINCLLLWMMLSITNTFATNFQNGGFEDNFTVPSPNSIPNINIPSWTSTGYLFTGYKAGLSLPPKSLNDTILAIVCFSFKTPIHN
jgi:hypothetical protein